MAMLALSFTHTQGDPMKNIHIHNYSGAPEEAKPTGRVISEWTPHIDYSGWRSFPYEEGSEVGNIDFKAGKTYQMIELDS